MALSHALPCRPLWATLMLLALAAPLAPTLAQAAIEVPVAEQVMRQSGLWAQIASLAPQWRSGFQTAFGDLKQQLNPAQLTRLDQLLDSAFAPAALQRSARHVVATRVEPAQLPPLQAWLASPLGQRMTALEEAAAAETLAPADASAQDDAALAAATPARRAQLKRLVAVTQGGEAAAAITLAMLQALGRSIAMVAPPGADLSRLQQASTQLQAGRSQLIQALATRALASTARVYAAQDDAALQAYIDFIATPAGQHYTQVGIEAVEKALVDAASRLGESLPALGELAKP